MLASSVFFLKRDTNLNSSESNRADTAVRLQSADIS